MAVAQAEVAGRNVAGGDEWYRADVPTTILKGAGIDMTSFGTVNPEFGDEVIIDADSASPFAYAKTVRRHDAVIGGVFINMAEAAVAAQAEYADYLSGRPAHGERAAEEFAPFEF